MIDEAKELLVKGAAELGVTLDSGRLGKLYTFAGELKKWSRKINLTAIRNDSDIVVKHFLDSLTLARVVKGKGNLLDIGSGGGFPAIPLKIHHPQLVVTSVDAVEKKIIFQRHVARLLQLHGFNALHVRGEELAMQYANRFDWVVSRAFSDIPTFVKIALPLAGATGAIVAMKGKGGREEAALATKSLHALGAEVVSVEEFQLPFSGDSRSLVIIAKSKN